MAFPDEVPKTKALTSNIIEENTKYKSLMIHLSPKKKPPRTHSCNSNGSGSLKFQKSENDDGSTSNKEIPFDDTYNFSIDHNIDQAEYGLRSFAKVKKVKLKDRIAKGPPESFRWISWVVCSMLPHDRSEEILLSFFEEPIDKIVEIQITKDLHRTLSEENLGNLEKCRTSLYKVLKSFACADQEVTYCQGMNFIAAFLLIISEFNEVDTFYMMISLFNFSFGDNIGIRGFYINEFPLLRLFMYQFDYLFKTNLPVLKNHFDYLSVPNELWVSKWFQTLFTICLPIDLTVRVWDYLIAYGLEFLFDFTLALLKYFEKQLLSKSDLSEIALFFKSMNPYLIKNQDQVIIDIEEIISSARKIITPKRLLDKLRKEFEELNCLDLSMLKIKYELISPLKTRIQSPNLIEDLDINTIELKKTLPEFTEATGLSSMKSTKLNKNGEYKFLKTISNGYSESSEVNISICSEMEIKENIPDKLKAHILKTNTKKEKSCLKESDISTTFNLDLLVGEVNDKIVFQNPFQCENSRSKNISKKEKFLNNEIASQFSPKFK